MSRQDQIAAALANADYIAADRHMHDYGHSQMRMDVFVLGKQIAELAANHQIRTSPSVAGAMAVVRNLDMFWSVFDVRHRDLRAHLLRLAGELRRISRLAPKVAA